MWIKTGYNEILEIDECSFISYNPNPGVQMGKLFGADIGKDETAIVVNGPDGTNYYILNGDFRKEYEECNSLDECMAFFNSKPELKSSWSN